ncbi:hypothetical protein J6590_077852 [Homalodisca vitripennis]|nr:hypothetical protein J6590_077852 [Homalodisca vitripennis]
MPVAISAVFCGAESTLLARKAKTYYDIAVEVITDYLKRHTTFRNMSNLSVSTPYVIGAKLNKKGHIFTPGVQGVSQKMQKFALTVTISVKRVNCSAVSVKILQTCATVETWEHRYGLKDPAMQKIIKEEIDKMLVTQVIEPSISPWSSP